MFPKRVPMERKNPFPKPMVTVFINAYWSPWKRSLLQYGEKHKFTVHAAPHGQKAYIQWVRPCSLMTLLSLSQCHAAFSTISSTLGWVEQSLVRQCVVATLNRVYPIHLLLPPMWPRGRVWIYNALKLGRGVGFMGGCTWFSWQWHQ
jgi:hypothetical protein